MRPITRFAPSPLPISSSMIRPTISAYSSSSMSKPREPVRPHRLVGQQGQHLDSRHLRLEVDVDTRQRRAVLVGFEPALADLRVGHTEQPVEPPSGCRGALSSGMSMSASWSARLPPRRVTAVGSVEADQGEGRVGRHVVEQGHGWTLLRSGRDGSSVGHGRDGRLAALRAAIGGSCPRCRAVASPA